jgi:ubiquinone/menaquinone biosynthesis C-methylase UbiE
MSESDLQHKIDLFDQQFQEYLAENPQGKFSDFYVQQAMQSIEQNIPHPTLGGYLRSGEEWHQAGIKQLDFLQREGLQPQHTVVDYGCGSLRVGQHLIRYLEPGNYWGLDITEDFMQMGLDLLPPELISEKKPNLHVIDPAVCVEARRAAPDLVYCRAVLRHVPPADIGEFIASLMQVATEKTQLLVTGVFATKSKRISTKTWAHTQPALRHCIEQHGARVQFEARSEVVSPIMNSESARSMLMRIRWPEARLHVFMSPIYAFEQTCEAVLGYPKFTEVLDRA